jgi:hypothetical protein
MSITETILEQFRSNDPSFQDTLEAMIQYAEEGKSADAAINKLWQTIGQQLRVVQYIITQQM